MTLTAAAWYVTLFSAGHLDLNYSKSSSSVTMINVINRLFFFFFLSFFKLRQTHSSLRCSVISRYRWLRSLMRGWAAVRLLGSQVRILPEACRSSSCECCVLSGRALCDGQITRPEESYRVWDIWVWSRNLTDEAWAR